MTSRQLRALTIAFNEGDSEKSERIFYDISHSLSVVNFDPINPKYKPGLLVSIMNSVLPLLSYGDLKMRLQAESFLGHWSSVISAFSPDSLLKSYQLFDTVSTLPPVAQATLFNFFTNTILSIPPSLRFSYISMCHCMLMSSKPALLTKLTQDVWVMLRSELTLSNVASIVQFLVNSPIPKIVAFLCMKDPGELFPIVAKEANLQFLKEFIPQWPEDLNIDINLLGERIVNAINSNNANDISAAIEIVELISEKMSNPPLKSHFSTWKSILTALSDLWISSACTISHKSALITLASSLSKFEMIPHNELRRFMVLDPTLPTTLQVSIIKLASFFIKKKKIPLGLVDYLKTQAINRDPLIYVAILQFLQNCFNDFFKIAPKQVHEILELCLHPLPRYFVEQLQILKLFDSIDWTVFKIEMLPKKLFDIILVFLKEPHPSVVKHLSSFIQKMKVELPYSSLDWFEDASYFLSIFHILDPFFIIELLDTNIIPPASYPLAANAIAQSKNFKLNIVTLAPILFNRILYIIIESIKTLGFEIDNYIKSLYSLTSSKWESYAEKMPQLFDIISESFSESTFGKIIETSLNLIVIVINEIRKYKESKNNIKIIELSKTNIIGFINISRIFASCFTETTCRLLLELKEIQFDDDIQNSFLHYFDRVMSFKFSEIISLTAIQTIYWNNLFKLREYLDIAADINGEILIILDLITDDELPPHRSFLALKYNKEYIQKCIDIFPFHEWILCEDDFDFIITNIKKIPVEFEKLGPLHKCLVENHIECFEVNRRERKYSHVGDFTFHLTDSIFIGKECEIVDMIHQDKQEVGEIPEIPFNPYQSEKGSKYELMSFLWFSNRNSNSWEQIEEYAFKVHKDSMFVASFFSYAKRKQLPINLEKWPSLLKVNRNSHFSLISVSLYFSFLIDAKIKYSDLTDDQLYLIDKTILALGIPNASEYSLIQALKQETGLNRLIIENIIQIDPSRFTEIPHLNINNVNEIINLMKNESNEMFLTDCFSKLVQLLFPNLKHSHYEQFKFPPSIGSFFSSCINSEINFRFCNHKFERIKIDDEEILNSIIEFISATNKYKHLSNNYLIYYLINNIELSENQLNRVISAIPQCHPLYGYYIGYMLEHPDNNSSKNLLNERIEKLTTFILNKPPSFSRETASLILDEFISLSKSEKTKFAKKALPVFYEFLFPGFDLEFPSIYDSRFPKNPESILFQYCTDNESFNDIRNIAATCSYSLHSITHNLFNLSENEISSIFNATNIDLAKMELCGRIATLLSYTPKFAFDTIFTMHQILDKFDSEQLIIIFISSIFLNSPNKQNIFICAKMILQYVKNSENKEINKQYDLLNIMIQDRIENKAFQQIFLEANSMQGYQILCKEFD